MKSYALSITRLAFATLLFTLFCNMAFGQAETQNASFPFWKIRGNANIDTTVNFVGTTDARDLTFRTNNFRRMTINQNGLVGIGTGFPVQRLHIGGGTSTMRIDGLQQGIGTFITAPASATDKIVYVDIAGDVKAIPAGTVGQTLTINGIGIPAWTTPGSGTNWTTTGNAGTTASTNFLGTTDGADFTIKVNNIRAGFIERITVQANTFLGSKAGSSFTSGLKNAFFGAQAAEGWDGGSQNSVYGAEAGAAQFGLTTSNNSFFGYRSGYATLVGGISAFGTEAGTLNRSGKFNTYVGYRAGFRNMDGSNNTMVGDSAGVMLNGTGPADYQNVFIGAKAGLYPRIAGNNTLLGYATGSFDVGNFNTLVGSEAGSGIFGLNQYEGVTAIGYRAGFNNQVGKNTFTGYMAGFTNSLATSITAIGYAAGYLSRGSNNTFVGDSAGYNGSQLTFQNTYVGAKAGWSMNQGANNVALGYRAMAQIFNQNTLVSNTTAIGTEAGQESAQSDNSTFVGYRSGQNGFNSSENIMIGAQTGLSHSQSIKNVFVGNNIAQFANGSDNNVIMGYGAALNINNSDNNVVVGYNVLPNFSTGNKNVVVGANIPSSNFLTESVVIGELATPGNSVSNVTIVGRNTGAMDGVTNATAIGALAFVGQSNALILGNNADVGINTSTPARKFHVAGNNSGIRFGSLATGGLFNNIPSATTDRIMYVDANGDVYAMGSGSTGQVLTYTASGPAWSAASGGGWGLTGNAGTNASANFLGTTDNHPLVFRVNNVRSGYIDSSNTRQWTHFGAGAGNIGAATGITNTGIGYQALAAVTSGNHNTALGATAMPAVTGGARNVAIGSTANQQITSGNNNIGIGFSTLSITDGDDNIALGEEALGLIGTSNRNVAIGKEAIFFNSSSFDNVAVGNQAMRGATTASENVAIGSGALVGSSNTGQRNVAIGRQAMNSVTSGFSNTAVGYRAGFSLSAGLRNVIIGDSAGRILTSATHVTMVGYAAGLNATSSYATLIGEEAGLLNQGTGSVFVGSKAGMDNTTGAGNTFIGDNAGTSNSTGSANVVLGSYALQTNTTAQRNTAIGTSAMYNSNGSYNTAVGYETLNQNTTGRSNVAIGTEALRSNTTVSNLVAVGDSSMFLNSTGAQNTALGSKTLLLNTTGADNTALGYHALDVNVGGGFNTAVGSGANVTVNSLNYTTALGYNSKVSANNNLILGDTVNRPQVGVGVTAVGKTLSGTRFEVASEGTIDNILYRYQGTGTPTFNFQRSLGSLATPTVISSSSTLGRFDFYGYEGANWDQAANIVVASDTTIQTNIVPGRISFSTQNFAGSLAERMRIDKDGDVGIGTTNPLVMLHVAGGGDLNLTDHTSGYFMIGTSGAVNIAMDNNEIMCRNNGTISTLNLQTDGGALWMHSTGAVDADDFYVSSDANVRVGIGVGQTPGYQLELATNSAGKPGSTVWAISSDERLKKDVRPYEGGLKDILKINPVWYHYNGIAGLPTDEEFVGAMAQNIEKVAPYMIKPYIDKDADGKETEYKSVDYNAMLFMFVNSFKEQQKMIDDLQKQVQKQQLEIERLNNK